MRQLLHLSLSEKGINEDFNQMLVFFVLLLHCFELLQEFLIRELGRNHFILTSIQIISSCIKGISQLLKDIRRRVRFLSLIPAYLYVGQSNFFSNSDCVSFLSVLSSLIRSPTAMF